MPVTDHRITKAPKLNAAIARKHNGLVKMLSNLRGANGIRITKTANNIIISVDPNTFDSPASYPPASELHYNDGTTTIDIDGVNGISITQGSNVFTYLPSTGNLNVSTASYAGGIKASTGDIFIQTTNGGYKSASLNVGGTNFSGVSLNAPGSRSVVLDAGALPVGNSIGIKQIQYKDWSGANQSFYTLA